jgi:hypothetical protein
MSTTRPYRVTKVEAARQEYLDKIKAHTTRGKLILDLDKILGEKRVELDERERDMELCTVALVEVQARGFNPRDNHHERMEFVERRWLLWNIEADHVVEASQLAALVRDVSHVLENLGMPYTPGIPLDPCMTDDVLGPVGVILERVKVAHDSRRSP